MAVIVHRTARDVVTVTGPEAVAWLQGQLSQDLAALQPGQVAWTFVLSPQGKVDGWGRIITRDDGVEIDVDPGAGAHWRARLERFKLRTKADVDLREDVPVLAVRGAEPDGSVPAGWPARVGGDVFVGADDPTVLQALVDDGAAEVDGDAFEAERIRAGVPRWGAEVTDETIPATLGQWVIDASVSFTKGCYTGQELVARIDSRGGNVPRRLVLVESSAPITAGSEIVVDGVAAGAVTSAAPDRAGSGGVALAFLKRAIDVPTGATVDGEPVTLGSVPTQ